MRTIVFLLSLMFIFACQAPEKETGTQKTMPAAKSEIRDGIFIHITESYNDPHRVLMPMKMANMMAKDKDVLVYLDIHAVELVVKTAKDLQYKDFKSFRTYLKGLIDLGVGVYACPTCLKLAGFKPEDLLPGVQVAQKDKFFDFTKGKIISLDY